MPIVTSNGLGEVRRVQAHLRRAERRARRHGTPHLDPFRRKVRALLLDELARYRRRARFPLNHDFATPTPYFIDRDGTRCAMAHLLEMGGEGALVQRIARERNNARVKELADEPRLLAWLDAAGLTAGEAAAIQPSYCVNATDCVCKRSYPVMGVLETELVALAESGVLEASVRITAVHGELPAYPVGDVVDVTLLAPLQSNTIIVAVDETPFTDSTLYGTSLTSDGTFACSFAGAPPLPKEQYIAALQSRDCAYTLTESDEAWRQNSCGTPPDGRAGSGPGENESLGTSPRDDGGCSVPLGSAGEPTTLAIFTALVAALAARRGRRQAPKNASASSETPTA